MSNKKFTESLSCIASFLRAHPEIEAEKAEFTIATILKFLAKKKKDVSLQSMTDAWNQLVDAVEAFKPEDSEPEPEEDAELDKLVAQIDSWTSDEMREYLKDGEVAAATERVLAAKARQKPKQAKPQPKPQPKPPVKKDPLIDAINKMSAKDFKAALSDPAKARGIEQVLSKGKQ